MEIFKLFGSIFVDSDKADKSLQKTEGLATKLGKGMQTVVKTGLKVAAGIGAVATAAGAAITSVADNTREYRNEMAKLDTAFQSAEHSSEAARTTYKSLQKLLGETGQAVEAANHLAELCDTEKQLATWTDICTGVYAKFGVSIPIEGLTEAANETAKTGALTGALADALNWVGVNEEAFQAALDKCNTEQERQQLITETLNNLYKESADLYKKNNEAVLKANEAQEKINAAMASFGDIVEPVVSSAKEKFAGFLEALIPIADRIAQEIIPTVLSIADEVSKFWTETLEPAVGAVGDALLEVGDAFAPIIQGFVDMIPQSEESSSVLDTLEDVCLDVRDALLWVAEKLEKFSTWITDNKPLVEGLIIVIGSLTAAWILINGTLVIWNATAATATALTTALGAAVSFLTSPIGIAVIAIGTLIAIGVLLYKNWDVIKEKALELWNKVTDTFEKMKMAVQMIISAMSVYFTEKIESMKAKATAVFDGIKNAIQEKIQAAKDFIGNCIEKIKGFFDFDWKLPELKMPHFSISGEFSLNPLKVPSIGVDWYAKAMNTPMILDEPTIFGFNDEGEPMGGGEAGSEVVSGTNTLMNMIAAAVASKNEALIAVLYMILEAILEMDQNMGGNMREALDGMSFKFDRRVAGRFVREVI